MITSQNWQISQYRPEQIESIRLAPEDVVKNAKASGCKAIAFTYSEPVVFYEYRYDIVRLAKDHGLKSVMISNGYIQEKPLKWQEKLLWIQGCASPTWATCPVTRAKTPIVRIANTS